MDRGPIIHPYREVIRIGHIFVGLLDHIVYELLQGKLGQGPYNPRIARPVLRICQPDRTLPRSGGAGWRSARDLARLRWVGLEKSLLQKAAGSILGLYGGWIGLFAEVRGVIWCRRRLFTLDNNLLLVDSRCLRT